MPTSRGPTTSMAPRAPAALDGLIEIRGVGIVRWPAISEANLALVADLVASDAVPRMPASDAAANSTIEICSAPIATIKLAAFEASAALKLLVALALAARQLPTFDDEN